MMTISRFTASLTSGKTGRKEWLQYGLIAAWTLAMIVLPIIKWTLGTDSLPQAVTFALLVQFAAVLTICHSALGWQRTLAIFGIVAAATWGVEAVGSTTGFPFGSYDYTDTLQPQLAHVPLLIPLAWFMMLPSAWAVAEVPGRTPALAAVRRRQRAGDHRLGSVPGSPDGSLGLLGMGESVRLFRDPLVELCRLAVDGRAGHAAGPSVPFWFASGAAAGRLRRGAVPANHWPSRILESTGTGPGRRAGDGFAAAAGRPQLHSGEIPIMTVGEFLLMIAAFVSGALPFSVWIGRVALRKDIPRLR
jgi:hypothetical protein